MNTPICDFLESYAMRNPLRLHMPGHNGEYPHDITEVFGADSLYETDDSAGIISCSERLASYVFGAERTCYSAGGSTLAIQTALALLKAKGCKTIAAPRYSHRSLVSAASVLGLDIKWLYPKDYLSAQADMSKEALNGADALFFTNIDYYGGTVRVEHPDIPVVCDNAHGAYLKFVDKQRFGTKYLHPMEFGYPVISAESAHKTLPVLTGGAYLHFSKGTDHTRAKEMMAAFGSSSPSYLILGSLDSFNKRVTDDPELVNRACESVMALKERLVAGGHTLRESDPLRITIDTRAWGYSGAEYAAYLRSNGTECEMADDSHVVLMFSAVTTHEDCLRAELSVSFVPRRAPIAKPMIPVLRPAAQMPVYEAVFKPQRAVSIDSAVGEVCGAVKCTCPPCVPLVMPGEVIDKQAAEVMKFYGVKTISVLD